ncbi:MarR family winged helix-turn-helix transcriptional regulator [Novosphingobium sp.]|uniref:MarR family winged helix-turn-helix transcriptional regulator n=1 Tax=Novosphingobium sp. TaxID=1874826 RepID=UPI003BAA3A41
MQKAKPPQAIEFVLNELTRRMRRVYNRKMMTAGISAQQAAALIFLDRFGPQSQLELGDRMELHKAAVAALLARMEDAGLVTRVPDKQDRRVRIVTMTTAARTHLEQINAVTSALATGLREGTSETDRHTAVAVLLQMSENLRTLEEDAREAGL